MSSFKDRRTHINRRLYLVFVILFGVSLSILGYQYSNQLESQQRQNSLSRLAEERQALLQTRVAVTVEVLDAVGSFIADTETPTAQAFRNFTLPILSRHPEFWAIHWVPRVSHDERRNFEQALSVRGFNKGITELESTTNWAIPSSVHDEYYPVLLSEPLDRNHSIIGFDANSRQINADVIKQILNQNINFLSTAPFKLVQDNEGSASVVFFRPVFSINPAPEDPQLRKQNIRGFIVTLVKPQTILNMLAQRAPGIAIQLRDIGTEQAMNIGSSGQQNIRPDWLSHQLVFSSLGRELQLLISIAPDHPALMSNPNRAIWVLISGISFTLILSAILFRLSQAHGQITRERDRAQSYLDTVETVMMAMDRQGRITMINRKGCEILGYREDEILNSLWYSPRYTAEPNDRFAIYMESMETGKLTSDMLYSESPTLDKQGNRLLIAWHNRLQFDKDGKPSGMLCAGEDITQKHYFSSLDRLRSEAMQSSLEGIALNKVLDKVLLGIESLNPGAKCSILLLDESGKHLMGCSAPSLPEAYNQAIDGIEIGDEIGSCGTAAFRQERVIVEDIQQHQYWAAFKDLAAEHELGSCWSEPIFGKKGRLLGTFAIYHANPCTPIERDLSLISRTADFVSLLIEEQQTEADLKRLATTDELTALPNRRKFMNTLEAELARAKRYNRQLSLCMLDLDHFKKINDRYGHNAGHKVLKDVASVMANLLRETDMAGRLGGEEFGILLPDTQEQDAIVMAERLRVAIEQREINHQGEPLQLTASIGVTSLALNSDISNASEFLSVADRCLYDAKQNGRNHVSNTPIELSSTS